MALTTRGPLIDSFGRVVRDLRISVTDRCNFRCTYCMPAAGLPWLPREELLTPDEIARLAGILVRLGVRSLKVTGGEPTARPGLVEIVGLLRSLDDVSTDGPIDISMTTNGAVLARLAQPLRAAGLDRVTVSCDSLLRHRFAAMTRRDALDAVLEGLDAAREAGFGPIKINCVVIAGTNDDEVVDFAAMARTGGYDVRFIEYMPLDAEHSWERAKVMPSARILDRIADVFPLDVRTADGSPAVTYGFADGSRGSVGVISSVTEPFCASCDRVRLTADGNLRACLFALDETNLRTSLRNGASDADLEELVHDTVLRKWAGHRINHPDFVRPRRSMSMIGG